ncbi:hypothetical protein [uncultured Polaribacter sp.]|uniref:hypothetical protein n=1 Tax=uncultured Polaribacter sp. TaxID=174711 RepID=UPI0026035432|nr:hypothetical protein [uncultured Polaribacter sp.]
MEYKNDFIEREVQRITQFIRELINKIATGGSSEAYRDTIDKQLKEKLDFGFYELLKLNNAELINKIKGVDVMILSSLVSLFYGLDIANDDFTASNEVKRVSLIIIEEIEKTTDIYSLQRQQIKNYFKSQKK